MARHALPQPGAHPRQATIEDQALADRLRGLLEAAGVNANTCAREINASHSQLYALLGGNRNISPLLALKLARYFDVAPEGLMLLQVRRDLSSALREHAQELEAIVPVQYRHRQQGS
ncbi:hypothetical protein OHC51_21640 [Stenotrophomonas indicatrix]|uniref:helix-turn-helix transcriptional regulator n=1 Tax=Stenotrophomonas indicatrix TaxID=2045451 RepID=UPI00300A18ED